MKLDQLDDEELRDFRTRESRDAVDIFLSTRIKPAGSKSPTVLALPEGVLVLKPGALDGDFTSSDIICHLCQRVVAASECLACRTRSAPLQLSNRCRS